MADLIVIGAGLTGLIAAHTAAKAGLSVKIVAKGLGATHWHAGTIDVLGYYPDNSTRVTRPFESIETLARDLPHHPYVIMDRDRLANALNDFIALMQAAGLPYSGAKNPNENLWLPSPVGAARPTFLAPRAQLAGDLSRIDPMLIVGVRGMRDFYPELIAQNLRKQGHSARAAFVQMETISDRHDQNTAQLALQLDDPMWREKLISALKSIAQKGERIGLPAILGMNEHTLAFDDLEKQIGSPIFEIPTLPPSVPGVRLTNALRQQLQKLGARVDLNMDVTEAHAENNRVMWIASEAASRPLKHRADHFLLATGGILGGGIDTDPTGKTWETIFNLPLVTPANRGEWFRARFLDAAGHPIFRAGVSVNCAFQPIDANGATVYSNMWAAGNVLAHADPILERSLEGIALATGMSAAQKIVRHIKGS